MTAPQTDRILGFLAGTALAGRQEVAATTSLAWLLRTSTKLRHRMVDLLGGLGVVLPDDVEWSAEQRMADRSRPDLEARLPGSTTAALRIEAKFSAALTDEQLVSFAEVPVVVLHPVHRAEEVSHAMGFARLSAPEARFASLTWDDLFTALTADLVDGVDADNVGQLHALAEVAAGLDILPFGRADSAAAIAARGKDLSTLVARASIIRGSDGGRLMPTTRDTAFEVLRYVPAASWAAVGLRRRWETLEPATPFWLRFKRGDYHYDQMRAAWESLTDRMHGRLEGEHLFFPLDLPRGVVGSTAQRMLTEQITELVARLDSVGGIPSLEVTDEPEPAVDETASTLYWDLTDRASRLLNPSGRLWPLGSDGDFERRRYIPAGNAGAAAAVGLRHGWDTGAQTPPLWLRFNRRTPTFAEIVRRWEDAGRPDGGSLEGHLFFPLDVNLTAADAVEQLIRRRDEVLGRYTS